jgi:hypothetical protein
LGLFQYSLRHLSIAALKTAKEGKGMDIDEEFSVHGVFLEVRPNRSFDSDTQVLQCASRTRLLAAGQLRR